MASASDQFAARLVVDEEAPEQLSKQLVQRLACHEHGSAIGLPEQEVEEALARHIVFRLRHGGT